MRLISIVASSRRRSRRSAERPEWKRHQKPRQPGGDGHAGDQPGVVVRVDARRGKAMKASPSPTDEIVPAPAAG